MQYPNWKSHLILYGSQRLENFDWFPNVEKNDHFDCFDFIFDHSDKTENSTTDYTGLPPQW